MKMYVLKNGQVLGPYGPDEISRQLSSGALSADDRFAAEGETTWRSLREFSTATPPPPAAFPTTVLPPRADPHLIPASAGSTSGLAIGALVAGILSLGCGLSAIVAVILGHLALGEIKRNSFLRGRELALAGLIIGYIVLGLTAIGIIFFIFFNAAALTFSHQLRYPH